MGWQSAACYAVFFYLFWLFGFTWGPLLQALVQMVWKATFVIDWLHHNPDGTFWGVLIRWLSL